MKTKDIEFNADDLVGSVEAFAQHLMGKQKLTGHTAVATLSPRAKPQTPSHTTGSSAMACQRKNPR